MYKPRLFDVLLGSGKPVNDHLGNIRMREITWKRTDQYNGVRKGEKKSIVEEVREEIETVGRYDGNGNLHVYQAKKEG